MRYRELTILSGVVAALALAQTPASALDLLNGRLSIDLGSKDGIDANVSAKPTSTTAATASANIGGQQTATANARLTTGTNTVRSLTADAVIDLSDDDLHATVDLNGDGSIDEEDVAAMARLDINGDGVLNLFDDANRDGLLTEADIDLTLPDAGNLIGGLLPEDLNLPPDETDPIPPAPPSDTSPDVTAINVENALHGIDDDDVAALKLKCVTILANPGFYDATTVSICRALGS
jgi:hypothetical protein